MSKQIKVSLDGGASYKDASADDVRIIYENVDVVTGGEEMTVYNHITFGIEGVVADVYNNDASPSSEISAGTFLSSIERYVVYDFLWRTLQVQAAGPPPATESEDTIAAYQWVDGVGTL